MRELTEYSNEYIQTHVCVRVCSPDNKRRTRYVQGTSDPEWHQTLVFINLTRQQLVNQTLELTVWDYDRFKTHDFLGEVILNMSGKRCVMCIFLPVSHFNNSHLATAVPASVHCDFPNISSLAYHRTHCGFALWVRP